MEHLNGQIDSFTLTDFSPQSSNMERECQLIALVTSAHYSVVLLAGAGQQVGCGNCDSLYR